MHHSIDLLRHLDEKAVFRETLGSILKSARRNTSLGSFQFFNRPGKWSGARSLIQEAAALFSRRNAFENTAAAERNHRFAACKGLHRCDSKVFFSGQQQAAAMCVETFELGFGDTSAKFYRWAGHGLQLLVFRSKSDNF